MPHLKTNPFLITRLFSRLKVAFKASHHSELVEFIETESPISNLDDLDLWISDLVQKTGKKIVLMIDEVDKSSNNQLFLDFLGMLRNKYLNRKKPGQLTFHSIILAGVYNVKNLRLKMGLDGEPKYNNLWNIAVDFNVDMSFNTTEIATMLNQYVTETGIELNIDAAAQSLFYYTSGYPFLVSKLCKIIHEEIIVKEKRKNWNPNDIERAVYLLLNRQCTNFETVIKNLENNEDLYEFVVRYL